MRRKADLMIEGTDLKRARIGLIDLKKFEEDLNSVPTYKGMPYYNFTKPASKDMHKIITTAIKTDGIQPEDKRQLVLKYLEIWHNKPGLEEGRVDLRGVDLYKTNLAGANLQRAKLEGANLQRANLQGASLQWASLPTWSGLPKTNLQGANLQEANLQRATLTRTDLSKTNLIEANLTGASLIEANLTGADLTGADLTGAILIEANLTGADLQGANLTGANLTGANLTGANLTGAILLANYLTQANNLTQEQKDLAICSTDELAASINSILEAPDKMNEETIARLPNLYQAAKYVGKNNITMFQNYYVVTVYAQSDDCRIAAEKLNGKFPSFADTKELEAEAKALLKGKAKATSNFLVGAAFLQSEIMPPRELSEIILPPELNAKILSEVIAGTAGPDALCENLAFALLGQAQGRFDEHGKRPEQTFSAREAAKAENLRNPAERSILSRIAAEKQQNEGISK